MNAFSRRILMSGFATMLLGPRATVAANFFNQARGNLFQQALPGVPTIITTEYVKNARGAQQVDSTSIGCGIVMQHNGVDTVVTVAHVVGTSNRSRNRDIYAYFPESKARAMEILHADWGIDLAILAFVDAPPINLPRFELAPAQAGDLLLLVSRIMHSDRVRKVGEIDEHSDKEPDKVLVQRLVDRWLTFKYPYDMVGKSGSPLLDTNGKVAGLLTQATPEALAGVPFTGLALKSENIGAFLNTSRQQTQAPAAQRPILNPGPELPGFSLAGGVPLTKARPQVPEPTQAVEQPVKLTVTSNGRVVTDKYLWTATFSQTLPHGCEPSVNDRVLQIIGGNNRILTDGRDQFLQNHYIGFSAILGSTFTGYTESIDLDTRVFTFKAFSRDNQHKVQLDVVPANVPPNRLANANDAQAELVRTRRSVLKVYIPSNPEFPGPGERPVELGPVDYRLQQFGHNWTSFSDGRGEWCYFRYRSYIETKTQNETVALYVYHLRRKLLYIASFTRDSGALLNWNQTSCIDQWAFLLSLTIFK